MKVPPKRGRTMTPCSSRNICRSINFNNGVINDASYPGKNTLTNKLFRNVFVFVEANRLFVVLYQIGTPQPSLLCGKQLIYWRHAFELLHAVGRYCPTMKNITIGNHNSPVNGMLFLLVPVAKRSSGTRFVSKYHACNLDNWDASFFLWAKNLKMVIIAPKRFQERLSV